MSFCSLDNILSLTRATGEGHCLFDLNFYHHFMPCKTDKQTTHPWESDISDRLTNKPRAAIKQVTGNCLLN